MLDFDRNSKRKVAAAGGVIGAVLASSCCIGPLVLLTLGVSGAWIGSLTALKAYQPVFVAVAIAFLAFGFWQVYGKSGQTKVEGTVCASTMADRVVKSALWLATGLVVLALSIDLWAPLFY